MMRQVEARPCKDESTVGPGEALALLFTGGWGLGVGVGGGGGEERKGEVFPSWFSKA